MKRFSIFWTILLLVFVSGCRERNDQADSVVASVHPPVRIVSTCPSITEVVFSLGLDDRLVAVSQFCKYPDAAQSLPHVGGYLDPNYEMLLELKPDLVLLLKENVAVQQRLNSLKIPWLAVDHQSIEGILESMTQIGDRCGVPDKARELTTDLRHRIERLENATAHQKRPKVLLALRMAPERIQTVMVSGTNPFFQESLRIVGAQNAMKSPRTPFPQISREGIQELSPDIIIDLAGLDTKHQFSPAEYAKNWQELGNNIPAVKNNRIYLMAEDYVLIPGPRFILFLEKLAEIVNSAESP